MPKRYTTQPNLDHRHRRCHAVAIRVSREQSYAATAVGISLCVLAISLIVQLAVISVVQGQDGVEAAATAADVQLRTDQSDQSDRNHAIYQALDKKLDFAFEGTSLEDVAKDLSGRSGVPIQIDVPALEDLGLDGAAKVSLRARNLSLRAGLNHLLRYWDLTWTVRNCTVEITTPEVAETELEGRFYNVRDLVCTDGRPGQVEMDALIDLVETTVQPDCWDDVGGPCSLDPFHELLIVHCLPDTHYTIDGLLVGVRELKRRYTASPDVVITDAVSLPTTASGEAIRVALEKKIAGISFSETPLDEAADGLSELSGVPIVIDRRALEDVRLPESPQTDSPSGDPGESNPFGGDTGGADPFGGDASDEDPFGGDPGGADPFGGDPGGDDPFGGDAPDGADPFRPAEDPFGAVSIKGPFHFCSISKQPPVSFQADDVTLRAALVRMLQPLDLVWIVRDEAIVITTPAQSECFLSTRAYPVRDLVVDQDGLSTPSEYDALIEVVSNWASSDTWDVVGGPGAIQPLYELSALVVSQTEEVHQEVADVLAGLRRGRGAQRPENPAESGPDGAREDRMILRVYYLHDLDKPLDATCVDDLLAIARDLATPRGFDEAPTSYVHKFGDAIIVHHRVGVHREFGKLLTKLDVDWRTTLEKEVIPSLLPIVGENGQSPGGFFDVEGRR